MIVDEWAIAQRMNLLLHALLYIADSHSLTSYAPVAASVGQDGQASRSRAYRN